MPDRDTTWVGKRADLLERLVAAQEKDAAARAKPPDLWQRLATPAAVLLSAAGIIWSIWDSNQQQKTSAEQFERTMSQNAYSDIVSGMASSSVGVQVSSIRSLVQHVRNPSNFDDNATLQQQAASNAAQTLTAFIEDESTVPDREGLTDFRDPQPVVVSRALDQLVELTGLRRGSEDSDEVRFPGADVDVSRGNFHGVYAPDFVPQGSFLANASDFRAATITGWDLTGVRSPRLSSAFFTCADLQQSDLGEADVTASDFTGANLRGADLSKVTGLTSEQLGGALIGPETDLPQNVQAPPQPGWGIVQNGDAFSPSLACRFLVDRMTNLLPGSGYSSRLPCGDDRSQWPVRLEPSEQAALHRVCQLRARLTLRQSVE